MKRMRKKNSIIKFRFIFSFFLGFFRSCPREHHRDMCARHAVVKRAWCNHQSVGAHRTQPGSYAGCQEYLRNILASTMNSFRSSCSLWANLHSSRVKLILNCSKFKSASDTMMIAVFFFFLFPFCILVRVVKKTKNLINLSDATKSLNRTRWNHSTECIHTNTMALIKRHETLCFTENGRYLSLCRSLSPTNRINAQW